MRCLCAPGPCAVAAASALTMWTITPSARAQESQLRDITTNETADADEAFARRGVLERVPLVNAALTRNPSARAALAAWRAALARVPQAQTFRDPMLAYAVAPLSIGHAQVPFGQALQIDQRLPFPGKRALAGDGARAEARALHADWHETRLELALAASSLYDDWYAVHRALDVNRQHRALVATLQKSAETEYTVGRGSPQDALEAESELAHLEHDGALLESQRAIIRARLNGLLHRPAEAPLPPPPVQLAVDGAAPADSRILQERALARRPALAGARASLASKRAGLALARRNRYPDFGLMASYNSMWMDTAHQYMVGVSIELPVFGARRAAVDEAAAELGRAQATLVGRTDDLLVEVEVARQRLLEALHVFSLYQTRLEPIARDQLTAARAGFESGRNDFRAVMAAERNLRNAMLGGALARADVARRRAELDRTTGDLPVLGPLGTSP